MFMKIFSCNCACRVKSARHYSLQSCIPWEAHSGVRRYGHTDRRQKSRRASKSKETPRRCGRQRRLKVPASSLVFSVWLLVKVDCNRERNREIAGIGGLMAWREEGKSPSIFTAILKALTAEMHPSIPPHDLMIRAASEGNGVLFSPPNP